MIATLIKYHSLGHLRKFRGVFLLTLIILFNGLPIKSFAQDALIRTVVISSEDGSPMVGANVLIYSVDDESELLYNCVTNPTGFCEIRGITPETEFELRISYVGFAAHAERFVLEPEERRTIRVELDTEVGALQDEAVVIGDRVVTTGRAGVQRVSSDDIARIPTPGVDGDLVSFLQTEPGIVTTGDRGGDLYIRGGTPDQNLVLVDNLPVVKPFHVSNLFSAFSEEVIQNADVYAGGYGAEYSNAMSAVIDISLRPGNLRQYAGSGAISPYMVSFHAEGPIVRDRQSFLVMGRKSTIEGIAPTLINEDIPLNFGDFIARYTLQFDNMSCNVTGLYTKDSGEIIPTRQIRSEWSNTVFGTKCLAYDTGLKYPIELSAGYSGYKNSERSDTEQERYSSLNQIYLNAGLREQIGDVSINYGFGVNFRFYDVLLSEKFADIRSVNRIIPIMNLYVSGNWEVSEKFEVQPGLATQVSVDHAGGLEPRLRMAWKPDGTDRQELSIAAGKYVQMFAGISDQRDIGAVFTVLQPIKLADKIPYSYHGIMSYEQRLGNSVKLSVEGYARSYENIPVSKWTPEARIRIETANAKGLAYGFDGRFQVQRGKFFSSVGYGWSKINYEATSGDLGAWIAEPVFEFSPAHDQRHKLNAVLGYEFFGFETNVRWELGSGKPYTQIFGYDFAVRVPIQDPEEDPGTARTLFSRPFGERLPYYHRLDFSVGRAFNVSEVWGIQTEAGVINTYDRNNVYNFDINTLQRVDQTPLFPYLSVKLSRL
jgi:hypothetical protein